MNDTTPEMAEKMREMMRTKTPDERLQMSYSMHDTSKELVTHAILRENPTISKLDLKKELFLKFYKDDFSLEQRQKIFDYFDRTFTG